MLEGSPAESSKFPAELILTAPAKLSSIEQIVVQNFDEYFAENDSKLEISLRRQWIGQTSETEHKRALSISSSPENAKWVYDTIAGNPRSWRPDWPIEERKTVYFLMIEKVSRSS